MSVDLVGEVILPPGAADSGVKAHEQLMQGFAVAPLARREVVVVGDGDAPNGRYLGKRIRF